MKVNIPLRFTLAVIVGAVAIVFLAPPALFTLTTAEQHAALSAPTSTDTLTVAPCEMEFTGDVAICNCVSSNIIDPTVRSWCEGTPPGTIMLGVDPASWYTGHWDGGSATATVYIGDIVSPTLAVLTVTWPDRDGKGIHSPLRDQVATITWDGMPIWTKRTRDVSTFGDYYAAQHHGVLATAVLTRSITHTLAFSVPAHTAWDISTITIDLYPLGERLRGIAYSPFRDCQNPHWGPFPSEAEVEEDIARLAHMSNGIRTYSSLAIPGDIPRIAHQYGLPVSAGAWLGREKDENGDPILNKNAEEIATLIDIAQTVPVDSVIVGNEVLLRGDLTASELISYIDQVKAAVDVPVTTAEIGGVLRQYPEVINAVDFIVIHIYPFWGGRPIEEAVGDVVREYQTWQREYPNKRIVIGETGWPSDGPIKGQAVPSLENQRRFFLEFLTAAEEHGIEFYYFDAFDELWKREGGVGSHWGYAYADRTGKHEVQSALVPAQHLASHLLSPIRDSRKHPMSILRPPALESVVSRMYLPLILRLGIFPVFTEYAADNNHFAPSGWMGDLDDIEFYECDRSNPHTGEVAIRVDYNPQGPQGWAGIFWQEPDGNWGTVEDAGYDLDNATYLSFYARGKKGGEQIEFLVGGVWGPHPDSQQPAISTDIVTLTTDWKEYTIDLRGKDLSQTIGGFAFVTNRCLNPEPVTFYLDDIQYTLNGDPGMPPPTPTPTDTYYFNVYQDKDIAGNHYVPSGFMGDTGDVSVNECWTEDTHGGSTDIRVDYAAQGAGPSSGCESYGPPCNWAGVYWQHPAENWGDRPGGYDLSGAQAVTFWVRGDGGGEKVEFKIGGIGRDADGTPVSPYPGSLYPSISTGVQELSTMWQPITLTIPAGVNLDNVKGGFLWVATRDDNPNGATFYLDDIRYAFNLSITPSPTPTPTPTSTSFPTPTPTLTPTATPTPEAFYVYADQGSPLNHFVPSGWMGDTGDITIDEGHEGDTCGGTTAIRVSYSAQGRGPSNSCESYGPPCWWAGAYWQEPEDNWGTVPDAGFDLSEYSKLVFCAKGETGGERIELGMGGIGRDADCERLPDAPYPDSACKSSAWKTLTTEWQEYTVDLTGQDLSYIIGGFLWATNRNRNPSGAVFYLDEIRYER